MLLNIYTHILYLYADMVNNERRCKMGPVLAGIGMIIGVLILAYIGGHVISSMLINGVKKIVVGVLALFLRLTDSGKQGAGNGK